MTSHRLTIFIYHLMTGLAAVALLTPAFAQAFFASDAVAEANSFAIGTVEVGVSTSTLATSLTASNTDTDSLTLSDTGSIASQYQLTASPLACGSNFYDYLDLAVTGSTALYDGLVDDLLAITSTPGTLSFALSATPGLQAANGETCTLEITIAAWQALFATPQYGFTDSETVVLTVTATQAIGAQPTANVVLNEIYPSVLSTTTQPLDREWIELYNGTPGPIDVAGWDVSEFTGGDINNTENRHTIVSDCTGYPVSTHMQPFGTTNTVIPAGGFLVVEFCGTASYLVDGGDTVRLYNAIGAFVDDHTFGATPNGKSHARIPDGGTWVDPLPTPGAQNVATRADLAAEGWTEAEIDAVLSTDSADHPSTSTLTTSTPTDLVDDPTSSSTASVSSTATTTGSFIFATQSSATTSTTSVQQSATGSSTATSSAPKPADTQSAKQLSVSTAIATTTNSSSLAASTTTKPATPPPPKDPDDASTDEKSPVTPPKDRDKDEAERKEDAESTPPADTPTNQSTV